jgi:translocation and assembly module TamA
MRRVQQMAAAASMAILALPVAAWAADPQSYRVTIAPTGQKPLDDAIKGSATLVSLRTKAPVGPFALVGRARNDVARLTEALHSFGYYLGTISVSIDGLPVDSEALPDKLDAEPKGSEVPVAITPHLGPLFHIGRITLSGDVPPGTQARLKLRSFQAAEAAPVLQAGADLQTDLQNDGRALAKVAPPVATLMVADHTLDVSYAVDAGPRVDIGAIAIAGERLLHESYLRRRLMLHQGQPWDPRQIEKARQDLAAVPAIASVRITHPDTLDADGQMPLFVRIAERKLHVVDLGAAYSTDLGGSVTASWTDRNMFGHAEQLTLSASATELGGTADKHPGYNVGATLAFPDWLARSQTLTLNAQALKEDLIAYDRTAALTSVVLSRKLTEELTASAGLAFEEARIEQEDVSRTYTLPQLPLTLTWDSTHSLFEPTHGFKAGLLVTPSFSLAGGGGQAATIDGQTIPASRTSTFAIIQASASTYLDLGSWVLGQPQGRGILAMRGLVGRISGADTFGVPPDQRFYAGGGGTIRGWRYQSVGPTFTDGVPVGGTSIEVGSVEWRQRIGASFGAVAFVDAGEVGGADFPGSGTVRIGAGAGLRYFTSFAPIRLDIAVPLNKDPSVKTDVVEAYIGIGEAF